MGMNATVTSRLARNDATYVALTSATLLFCIGRGTWLLGESPQLPCYSTPLADLHPLDRQTVRVKAVRY